MDFKILNFTIFCVNNVASFLNKSAKDVYHAMQNAGMIDGYIVPCYDVLHSFSKEYSRRFSIPHAAERSQTMIL